MPTFADAWNAHPPPSISLSHNPKTITVSGLYEEEEEVFEDEYADQDMDDQDLWEREAREVVKGVREVRSAWGAVAGERDAERERVWGEAMDIDYQLTPSAFHAPLLILDTNILLSLLPSLTALTSCLSLLPSGTPPLLELIVPGIVVSELDSQAKHNPQLGPQARRATEWVLGELRRRKEGGGGSVRVQREGETRGGGANWKWSHMVNDDLILDCCLYFSGTTQAVFLLTDDKNLSLKAESHDIPAIPGSRIRNTRKFLHDLSPALALDPAIDLALSTSADSIHANGRPSTATHYSRSQHQHQQSQHDQQPQLYPAMTPYPDIPHLHPHSAHHARHISDTMDIDPAPQPSPDPAPTPSPRQPTTSDQLKHLHTAFLAHIAPSLAQHVRDLHQEAVLRQQQDEAREKASLNSSIHARPPTGSRRRPSARSRAVLPALPDERPETWTPRLSLSILQHLPPPPRVETETQQDKNQEPIDWSCLLAFFALPSEPGYRPTGGSRGDWARAVKMMMRVGGVYGVEGWVGRDGDGEEGVVRVLEGEMERILGVGAPVG